MRCTGNASLDEMDDRSSDRIRNYRRRLSLVQLAAQRVFCVELPGADQGGSVLQKVAKPAPATTPAPVSPTPAPATQQPGAPQSSTPQAPAPATQPPASQPKP